MFNPVAYVRGANLPKVHVNIHFNFIHVIILSSNNHARVVNFVNFGTTLI